MPQTPHLRLCGSREGIEQQSGNASNMRASHTCAKEDFSGSGGTNVGAENVSAGGSHLDIGTPTGGGVESSVLLQVCHRDDASGVGRWEGTVTAAGTSSSSGHKSAA